MNLCTDSPGCAEEFFSAPPGWTCGLQEDLPQEFRAIALRLLGGAPVAAAWTDLPRPWQCAIVVEHAVRSQFDVLVSALREGLDVPDGLICLAASGEMYPNSSFTPSKISISRVRSWLNFAIMAFIFDSILQVYLDYISDIQSGIVNLLTKQK